MKIYTKTGDDGTTGLFGGGRVRKCDPRIACYGAIDELNAALGLAVASQGPAATGGEAGGSDLLGQVRQVQADLFVIGSHLATPDEGRHRASLPPLDEAMATRLERQIDAADAVLPPLRNFILPGGTELAARLHLARTICRRAERLLVEVMPEQAGPSVLVTYLNRLSDWLFVQARLANHRAGVEDIPWHKHG